MIAFYQWQRWSLRILIVVTIDRQWVLHQLDVNNTFLHGYLNEEVYMLPPEGYEKAQKGQVCKLQRSLLWFKIGIQIVKFRIITFSSKLWIPAVS